MTWLIVASVVLVYLLCGLATARALHNTEDRLDMRDGMDAFLALIAVVFWPIFVFIFGGAALAKFFGRNIVMQRIVHPLFALVDRVFKPKAAK